ncbi:MAG TPA: hypothetical protein VJB57_10520 [Dehalococcoidia bacterium]|nr:hypothetical protein [Dehalococcoidia bacterium]
MATRYDVGVENLMWGSDFPHHDSTFPRSRAVLDDILEDIPDEERSHSVRGRPTISRADMYLTE